MSDLVEAAINGEEVILLNGDRPAIKLMPIQSVKPNRQPGSAKGLILIKVLRFQMSFEL